MKNNHNINSFIAGEVSAKFYGRTTSQAYNDSCEELTNIRVFPQGGAGKREGTVFVKRIQDKDGNDVQNCAIIPFIGTDNTRWQLVITADPFPAQVPSNDPTQATNVFAVNMLSEEVHACKGQLNTTDWLTFGNDYYQDAFSTIDFSRCQYAQDGLDNLFISFDGAAPLIIKYFSQNDGTSSGQFKFRVHPYLATETTNSYGNWRRMPFLSPAFTGSSSLKVTVDGAGNAKLEDGGGLVTVVFTPNWVGRFFKFTNQGTNSAAYVVTNYVSATEVTIKYLDGTAQPNSTNNTYGGSTTDYFEQGYWDRITGYPRAVMFHENRLILGGSLSFPEYAWYSRINDYNVMDVRKLESDSDYATPQATTSPFESVYRGGGRPNRLAWLKSGKTLVVGTNFTEWIAQPADQTKDIGFDNLKRTLETPHGCAYSHPASIENTTVFLQRDMKSVRELVYNFNEDSFQANDLTIFNPDISMRGYNARNSEYMSGGIDGVFMQVVMQQLPYQTVWLRDLAGALYGITRERKQEVLAWHVHKVAGEYSLTSFDPPARLESFVKSLSVNSLTDNTLSDSYAEIDELWMAVVRGYQELEGDTCVPVLYLERMQLAWNNKNIFQGWETTGTGVKRVPVYMDCTYVTDGLTEADASGLIQGLPHSHGQEVTVVVNGKYFGKYTVDEGSIDISDKLTDSDSVNDLGTWQALIGLSYNAKMIAMCQEKPAQQGTSQGLPRRDHEIVIHFVKTIGAKFGICADGKDTATRMESVQMPSPTNQDDPPVMFTGLKALKPSAGYDKRPRIVIESDLPYPMEITHIVTKGVVYET